VLVKTINRKQHDLIHMRNTNIIKDARLPRLRECVWRKMASSGMADVAEPEDGREVYGKV